MAVVATGMALSAIQTLLTALQNKELKELCSVSGMELELRKLQDTVTTIKAVLMDVDFKQQDLTYEGQDWVKKLKDAVYDVDDLVDEYTTTAQQLKGVPGGKLLKKVRRFFTGNNQLLFSFSNSRQIKKIREYLDGIAEDHTKFGFSDHFKHGDNYKHVTRSREVTCPYVKELSIIGREIDKEVIVAMLLSGNDEDVSFASIVGMGGLGKTALAQLIFNDGRIKAAFGECMYWVCVSDNFGTKEILGNLLQKNELNLAELQTLAQSEIEGKKYLLVLDDVWCDKREDWIELIDFLAVGGKGSKILVTSRSREVANVSGTRDDMIHELKGLSEENSWNLFKTMAFKEREGLEDAELVSIGKEITKKCSNVPLSIKVIGSLLYGQSKSKWLSFQNFDLKKMRKSRKEDKIMSTLMFSYYNLTPELKSCFGICSLFPKDFVIQKKVLINLWLAHGYLIPTREDESMEDVGEDCFSILLQRCFFQDVKFSNDEVYSCTMHDLMHDLAQEVAGEDSLTLTAETENPRRLIRHLCIYGDVHFNSLFNPSKTLRTFFQLCNPRHKSMFEDVITIISHSKCLRVLYLSSRIRKLPNTFGNLIHLRYLDLSNNIELKMLPKSITKLHNLHILNLSRCFSLKELPEDTSKLVNLRTLDLEGCGSLTHMPPGMYNLTCLRELSMFVVSEDESPKHVKKSKLKDLKSLVNLRGEIWIKVGFCSSEMSNIAGEICIFKDKHLKIQFKGVPHVDLLYEHLCRVHETMLEHIYNVGDIKRIDICGYQGTNLPSWASPMAVWFPRLVHIKLQSCCALKHIASLSQLRHLKFLELVEMMNVEYMDDDAPSSLIPFFPSLEKLVLEEMNKLKGWWKDLTWKEKETGGGCLVDINAHLEQVVILPSFPCLRDLVIDNCANMTYFPPCPYVKKMNLIRVNDELRFCMNGGIVPLPSQVASSSTRGKDILLCLEELTIDSAETFNSVFREFVQGAVAVTIESEEVNSMERLAEGFQRCAFSLRHLEISFCNELKNLGRGVLENLTNLQSLQIWNCKILDLEEEVEEGMPWKCLRSLSSLTLSRLPKVVNMPRGLHYLSSLQSLEICYCDHLVAIGECLGFLTCLRSLVIKGCKKLRVLPDCINSLKMLRTIHIQGCPELAPLPTLP